MADVFQFAAQNTIAAIVFALLVCGVTRVWRNPPAAHVLWVLVLVRLAAPPVVRVDWPAIRLPAWTDSDTLRIEGAVQNRFPTLNRPLLSPPAQQRSVSRVLQRSWIRGRAALFWFWMGGTVLCAVVAVTRIVRFERLLRGALPAPKRLHRRALEVAARLGVRRAFDVRCVESVAVPFVWWAGGRATIVLPLRLSHEFDEQQVAMILAHELAHLRRRDHWVRGVELLVASLYWWNPLAWAVRRRIHHAEDLCCDAWVRRVFPDGTQRYAEAVFRMAESLNASHGGARLLPASPFVQSLSLKARIEMILKSRFAPTVSRKSLPALAAAALLVLPVFVQNAETKAWAGPDDDNTATTDPASDSVAASEFPYVVKFEQGATRFLDGDDITIVEVRGTAETFAPGNLYWIKGTYSLASHERAMLSAYTTAMDAENGTNTPFRVQSTLVDKGDGTFTLFLPMSYRGWPHVSFYPADGGEGFGGNYVGTGDSVLKRWWGSEKDD